ncbi:hypothetical protein RCL_jg16288.t1 [Rhizophagus clarus]|uniref:Uncharacterized protein n=1 Tax=Rhizophagus clarus TaxID=94130 RepID=A0A8H3M7N9_9GLOM|nr:hypothetical protein RCL_jg16288.t1 [Rhizophagus clarus]
MWGKRSKREKGFFGDSSGNEDGSEFADMINFWKRQNLVTSIGTEDLRHGAYSFIWTFEPIHGLGLRIFLPALLQIGYFDLYFNCRRFDKVRLKDLKNSTTHSSGYYLGMNVEGKTEKDGVRFVNILWKLEIALVFWVNT